MLSIEERFSTALHHTARAWRLALDARLKYLGIGQAGWMAIAIVAKASHPLSQKELANQLAVEGPTVVATVDRLMAAGLMLRAPCETDRRVKLLVLTDAGHALFAKVRAEADAFRTSTLSEIDRATLQSAAEILEALRARIESAT